MTLKSILPAGGQGEAGLHLRAVEIAMQGNAGFKRQSMAAQMTALSGQIQAEVQSDIVTAVIIRVGRLHRRLDVGVHAPDPALMLV